MSRLLFAWILLPDDLVLEVNMVRFIGFEHHIAPVKCWVFHPDFGLL
jgi:hypothetical protein